MQLSNSIDLASIKKGGFLLGLGIILVLAFVYHPSSVGSQATDIAIDFKGVSGGGAYSSRDNNAFDFSTNDFTIEFWYRPVITSGTWQMLVYKGGTSASYPGWAVQTKNTSIFLGTHDGSVERDASSPNGTLVNGYLYHVVA